jgi:competence protein ComEA
MLDEIDKGKIVAYVAAGLLVLAVVLRLHAHGGSTVPPATVSLAPGGAAGAQVAAPAAPAAAPSAPGGAPSASAGAPSPSARELWVDVAGAVRRPGLYKVPAGSRVAAAVEQAGGVSRHGDEAGVNLAAPLHDGQQVIVPRRGAAGGAAAVGSGGSSAGAAGSGPISLSQASEAQLETLDGIGPALAGRIIQYRQQHGGFRSLDELKEVSGIGDKRFQAMRGSLVP